MKLPPLLGHRTTCLTKIKGCYGGSESGTSIRSPKPRWLGFRVAPSPVVAQSTAADLGPCTCTCVSVRRHLGRRSPRQLVSRDWACSFYVGAMLSLKFSGSQKPPFCIKDLQVLGRGGLQHVGLSDAERIRETINTEIGGGNLVPWKIFVAHFPRWPNLWR